MTTEPILHACLLMKTSYFTPYLTWASSMLAQYDTIYVRKVWHWPLRQHTFAVEIKASENYFPVQSERSVIYWPLVKRRVESSFHYRSRCATLTLLSCYAAKKQVFHSLPCTRLLQSFRAASTSQTSVSQDECLIIKPFAVKVQIAKCDY